MEISVSRDGLSEKQLLYLNSKEDEVLFGGARGGGKSHVNRIGAVEDCLKYPGRNIIFVRPTIKSAKQQFSTAHMSSIIPRSIVDEETGQKVEIWRINKQDGYYEFANGPDGENPFDGGSTLILGGISTLQDAQDNYQGIEFISAWWDELTKADYPAIEYLKGSLRDTVHPVKFRAASNPGERSHKEVKAEYVTPWNIVKRKLRKPDDFNNKLSWKKGKMDSKTGEMIYITKSYIPATLDDNPNKTIRDNYIKQLMHLPEHLMKMYREGSWDTYEGKFWDDVLSHERYINIHDLDLYDIDWEWEKANMKTFLSLDWGYSDYTAVYWHLETSKGVIVTYKELYLNKMLMKEIAEEVEKLNESMNVKPDCIYMPWDVYTNKGSQFRTEGGEIIGEELVEVWRYYSSVRDVKASSDRKLGWQTMTAALKEFTPYNFKDDEGKLITKDAPKWLILKHDCPNLVEELEAAQIDDKDPNDIKLNKDHGIDSCRMFWVAHVINPKILKEAVKPAEGTGAWVRYIMEQKKNKAKKRQKSLFNTGVL